LYVDFLSCHFTEVRIFYEYDHITCKEDNQLLSF
jgi:hypothetical protein